MDPEKNKGGRPPFEPTEDERGMVEQMAAVGITHEQIAMVVRDGIDADTLKKHFKKELRESGIRANAKVAGHLFKKAISGDTASMIFWLKTRAQWRETTDVNFKGDIITRIERVIIDPKNSNS